MHNGRGSRPTSGIATVAPVCTLVQESLSAELDGETAPLSDADVGRHLHRCATCRLFQARAATVSALAVRPPPAAPAVPGAFAGGGAWRRRRGTGGVTRLVDRWRVRLSERGLPWAVLAMAVGIALPPVSIGALAHLHSAYAHHHVTCSVLLHYAQHALKR